VLKNPVLFGPPNTHMQESILGHEIGPQFDQINHEMAAFIAERYPTKGSIESRFKSWWLGFATFCVQRPLDMIFMDQVTSNHLYPQIGSIPSQAFYGETRKIIMEGQESGLIKATNPSLINQFVRVAITNVVKINVAAGKSLESSQIEWIVDACWDGIRHQDPD
jgi:hypothetical protein